MTEKALTSENETPEQMAARVVEHLMKPETRQELARKQSETDAYFKRLRKELTPSWEDLHRPFDI